MNQEPQKCAQQIQRTNEWLPEGRGAGGRAEQVKGIKMYKLLGIKLQGCNGQHGEHSQ